MAKWVPQEDNFCACEHDTYEVHQLPFDFVEATTSARSASSQRHSIQSTDYTQSCISHFLPGSRRIHLLMRIDPHRDIQYFDGVEYKDW